MKLLSPRLSAFAAVLSFAGLTLCAAAATEPLKPLYLGVPTPTESDFFAALDPHYPGLEGILAAAQAGDIAKAKQVYLDFRRRRDAPRFFVSPFDKPTASVPGDDPEGDAAARNEFKTYDMISKAIAPTGRVTFPDPIDWTYNPVPRTDPAYNEEFQISVNRMGAWGALGKAYWKTGDEKYARAWAGQLTSWIQECPQPMTADEFWQKVAHGGGQHGPWRTLDTAIRLDGSWPGAYARFLFSPAMTPDVNFEIARSELQQGRWVAAGLENHPERNGNWVVLESSGLYTMATLFPEFAESGHLRRVALERLGHELQNSVYPDGAEIELTTHYHQAALESFSHVVRLAKLNAVPVDASYLDRLKPMYEFELAMMDQKGNVPMLNDGLPENYVGPLTEGSSFWPDDDRLKFGATLGKEGTAPPLSQLLPYSGYALMRDHWGPGGLTLTFLGGPIGSGHWHEDGLSLDLSVDGQSLLTEAGHYTYDASKWRYYSISTEGHSTVMVDGKGQHRGLLYSKVPVPMVPASVAWMTCNVLDFAASTYDKGYAQEILGTTGGFPIKWKEPADWSVSHTRQVLFLKPGSFLVLDFLNGTGKHRYDAYFHLDAPEAALDATTLAACTQRPDHNNLALIPVDRDGLTARVVKGQEDPPLGWLAMVHRAIPVVIYSKTQPAPATLATLLVPTGAAAPAVTSEPIQVGDEFWARKLTFKGETDEVFSRVAGAGQIKVGDSKFVPGFGGAGQVFVFRKSAGESVVSIAGYGVTQFGQRERLWKISQPAKVMGRTERNGDLLLNNAGEQAIVLTPVSGGASMQLAPQGWFDLARGTAVASP